MRKRPFLVDAPIKGKGEGKFFDMPGFGLLTYQCTAAPLDQGRNKFRE
jgi:hypothetical protein